MLVTTDFTLEGRHFRRDRHPPESVGHRCLARGLSDLAAMGATPEATVSVQMACGCAGPDGTIGVGAVVGASSAACAARGVAGTPMRASASAVTQTFVNTLVLCPPL